MTNGTLGSSCAVNANISIDGDRVVVKERFIYDIQPNIFNQKTHYYARRVCVVPDFNERSKMAIFHVHVDGLVTTATSMEEAIGLVLRPFVFPVRVSVPPARALYRHILSEKIKSVGVRPKFVRNEAGAYTATETMRQQVQVRTTFKLGEHADSVELNEEQYTQAGFYGDQQTTTIHVKWIPTFIEDGTFECTVKGTVTIGPMTTRQTSNPVQEETIEIIDFTIYDAREARNVETTQGVRYVL